MATNEEIFDAFIKHQVYLQRLTAGQASRLIKILNGTDEALALAIYSSLEIIRKTKTLSKTRSVAYASLLKKIKKARKTGLEEVLASYVRELELLIDHEVNLMTKIYNDAMPIELSYKIPKVHKITPAILAYGQFNGHTVQEWFNGLEENDAKRIFRMVKNGVAQGLTNDQIIRSVLGSKNLGYKDGINNRTRNSVRNMVRTITTGISTAARNEWAFANKDLIAYEVYTAVLDGRTTLICANLDGQHFPVGEGPMPPLHINCRSTRVQVVDLMADEGLIGDRPYVADTRTPRQRRIDFRAQAKAKAGSTWRGMSEKNRRSLINIEKRAWQEKVIGQVPAQTSFTDWFDRQSATFQRDYLGKTRYEAYRDGTPLSSFVSPNGVKYTIEELITKEII